MALENSLAAAFINKFLVNYSSTQFSLHNLRNTKQVENISNKDCTTEESVG